MQAQALMDYILGKHNLIGRQGWKLMERLFL